MAESKTEGLPEFASLDALVEFFDTHDMGDYLEKMAEVECEVELRRRKHLFALDSELAEKIAAVAQARDVSSQELIQSWLKEKLLEQA